ncbi:MAG: hypothetical protein IID44_06970 [Planctomycetes bacterium]|nr:hypothetical protein [Planctomycetota bacterium]
MSSIPEIEAAIRQLAPDELAAFRCWFTEFDAAQWDRQVEQDVAAGRLDALADEALSDQQAGRTRQL